MSVYFNGRKCGGAYINGYRVNGLVSGVRLFHYQGYLNVNFVTNSQTVGSTTLTGKYLQSATVNPPDNYTFTDGVTEQYVTLNNGTMDLRVYENQPQPTPTPTPTPPSTTVVQVNFVCGGQTVGTHTYSGTPGSSGYAGFDVPNGYSLAGQSFANFTYGSTDQFGYNVYVTQNNPQPAPYIPPASSYTPQPQPAPQPVQPTMITRPIDWMVPVDSSDYVTGGSDYISAPEGTVASLTGLAAMGITISAPDGHTFDNKGNSLHFYGSDQNVPVQIQLN